MKYSKNVELQFFKDFSVVENVSFACLLDSAKQLSRTVGHHLKSGCHSFALWEIINDIVAVGVITIRVITQFVFFEA